MTKHVASEFRAGLMGPGHVQKLGSIPNVVGDVSGPSSSVLGRIAVFGGTSGKAIADSGVSLSDFMPITTSIALLKAYGTGSKFVLLSLGVRTGIFELTSGTKPADPAEAIFIDNNAGGYYWKRLYDGDVNFLWFAGVNTTYGTTVNNWTPFQRAVELCATIAAPVLYIPAARYGFTQAPIIDTNFFRTVGLTIRGDGRQRTIMDMRKVTTSPNMHIRGLIAPADNFYLVMRDIGWVGEIAGFVCQMGQDDYSDPVNMPYFENVTFQNFNTTSASRALKMNFVVGGWLDMQVNCGSGGYEGGNGIALTMRKVGFTHFFGSYGSSEIGIQLQDDENMGNVFNCLDIENVKIPVRVASGTPKNNTFISGQWSYSVAGIDCLAGYGTVLDNPNPYPHAPVTAENFIAGTVGLEVRASKSAIPSGSTPGLPASGGVVTNNKGRRVYVAIWGGTVTSISVNGFGYGLTSGFLTLEPGDTIAVSYSAAPTWVWRV